MKHHVLVVESDPWLAHQYVRLFKKHTFTASHVTDGHLAIDSIEKRIPSVILINLMLNGPSSLALLHELQSYIDTAAIPVIAYSSLGSLSIEDVRPYGVHRLLQSAIMKPDEIIAAVRSALHENNEV